MKQALGRNFTRIHIYPYGNLQLSNTSNVNNKVHFVPRWGWGWGVSWKAKQGFLEVLSVEEKVMYTYSSQA